MTNANRFQFSIRLMLVATAAVAAAVGAVSAEPSAKTCIAITMIATLFAAISVIGAVQTDRTARVFWIGLAIPTVVACVAGGVPLSLSPVSYKDEKSWPTNDDILAIANRARFIVAFLWTVAPLNGILSALTFRLLYRTKCINMRPSAGRPSVRSPLPSRYYLTLGVAALLFAIAVMGLWFTETSWKSGVLATFFLMAVPAFSLAVVVNTRCYCRSFFIGFLIPAAFLTLGHLQIMQELFLSSRTSFTIHQIENMFSYLSMTKFVDAIILAFCPVIGSFCVLVHFLLWPPRAPPPENDR